MGGQKVSVTFRLGEEARDRMLEASKRGMSDIHTISDALQDAVWLWLYEDEQLHGRSSARDRDRVGTTPHKSGEPGPTEELDEGVGPVEGSAGGGSTSAEGAESVYG